MPRKAMTTIVGQSTTVPTESPQCQRAIILLFSSTFVGIWSHKVEYQKRQWVGSGDSEVTAKKHAAQQAIDFCMTELRKPITDIVTRLSIEENLIWATVYKAAIENGIAQTYQYPRSMDYWRNHYGFFDQESQKIFGRHELKYTAGKNNIPYPFFLHSGSKAFPFVGFGRSPQEAQLNALKYVHQQLTIRLRNSVDKSQTQNTLKKMIDFVNNELATLKVEPDIYDQVKAVTNFKEAWSEAPKPIESEPVNVGT